MRRGKLYLLTALATAVGLVANSGLAAAQGSGPPAVQPLPPVTSDDPWFGAVQSIAAPQAGINAGVKWQRLIFAWNQIQPDGPSDFKQGEYSDAQVDAQIAPIVEIGQSHGLAGPLTARLLELIHDLENGRRRQGWATLDELVAAHEAARGEGGAA